MDVRGSPDSDMRPILLTNNLNSGGAERVLVTLCNQWHQEGKRCRVVSLYPDGALRAELSPGVPVDELNCRTRDALLHLNRLFRDLPPQDPLLVFSTDLAGVIGVLKRLGWCRQPVLYRELNAAMSEATRWERWNYRLFISALDGYVAQTQATADDLRAVTRSTKAIELIANPCRLVVGREHLPMRLPRQRKADLECLAVGHFKKQKGYDRLLPAFRRLLSVRPEARLRIAGDGLLRDSILEQIQRPELGERVRWLRAVADPVPLYESADVLILASYYEGLPNVVIESLALGCPVLVAEGRGGTIEFMKRLGLADFVVPDPFIDNLPLSIDRLLRSDVTIWNAARERMVEIVNPARIAAAFWRVLEGLVARAAPKVA